MPRLEVNEVSSFASGLHRPECVRFGLDGAIYASDARGGISSIDPDGKSKLMKAGSCSDLGEPLFPNGIQPEKDGSFLIAHLGQFEGGVFRMDGHGQLRPVFRKVDGIELPPTNYVTRDPHGRVWCSVSTKMRPRSLDYRKSAITGFVVMDDGRGPRIVGESLAYTNECAVSPDGNWLYINETFAKRTIRAPISPEGRLGRFETVAEFGAGEFPDGMAFDKAGNLWIVCIFGNSVIRLGADGTKTTIISEPDPEYVQEIEAAFESDGLSSAHVSSAGGSRLKNISSIAFGGVDGRTAYLGCLQGDTLFRFTVPAN